MAKINFNSLPSDKPSNFAVIPKGKYLAKIVGAEMKTPKAEGKADYLLLTLDISNPADLTPLGKVWDIVAEPNAGLTQYKLKRLIEALRLPITGEFELKDLVKMVPGKEMLLDITVDETGERPRSVVDALSAEIYYPVDFVAAPGVPDEMPVFEEEDTEY